MEIFSRGWGVVQTFLSADAKLPPPAALPNAADRQVAQLLVQRRLFKVLEVIDGLAPLAQPELLDTNEKAADLVLTGPGGDTPTVSTGAILAPMSRQV